MPVTQIYTLSDPRTGDIRYVGKTRDAKARIRNHLNKREHNHKGNWIESLRKLDLEPEVTFIDEVLTEDWSFWEQHWIQVFRGWGFPLTNMTSGGGEHSQFTPELKKKHRASFTNEVRQVMREKAISSMGTPSIKAKHVVATALAMKRPEVAAKLQKKDDPANAARSAKVRAQWADPAVKAERIRKMVEANASKEVIAKRSAAAKKQFADGRFSSVQAAAHAATSKSVILEKEGVRKEFKCINDAALFLEVNRSTVGRKVGGSIKGWVITNS